MSKVYFPVRFFDAVEVVETIQCPYCRVIRAVEDSCCPMGGGRLLMAPRDPSAHLGAVCE